MLRAGGAHEDERIVGAISELTAVVHVVVFPAGLVEAENAPHSGESWFFKRPMERKKAKPNGQRSNRSEESEVNGCFPFRWGGPKSGILMKHVMG